MATRKARKAKRRERRLHRLALLSLALSVTVLVLVLILRPRGDEGAAAAPTGDAMWDGSWYEDDLGRIDQDRSLIRAMETYEQRTGVRPYLSLQSDIEPEELNGFAAQQYEALFSEGDHLLVVYDEWDEGTYYLTARTNQGSALTPEQATELLSAIETAYADKGNDTYADAFAAGFRAAAKKAAPSDVSVGTIVLLVLAGVMLILSLTMFALLRKRARLDWLDWEKD